MKLQNLFWWHYKPSDEREQALYHRAYSAAFKTLIMLNGAAFVLLATVDQVRGAVVMCGLLTAMFIAYLVGWTVLRNEELSLQTDKPLDAGKIHKTIGPLVLVIYAFYICALFVWPNGFFVLTVFAVIAARVALSIGAYIVSVRSERYVRWLMALCIPLTALVVSRLKGRSPLHFFVALVIAIAIYGLAFIAPIALARSLVVMPVYVATDAFAPDLTQNEYRFVDKTAQDFVIGDYIVLQSDRGFTIGQVTTVNKDSLELQLAEERATVSRKEVIGRLLPTERWVQAVMSAEAAP